MCSWSASPVASYPERPPDERQTLARFLELPDPVLVDYLLGQAIPPDRELVDLVAQIAGLPPRTLSRPQARAAS